MPSLSPVYSEDRVFSFIVPRNFGISDLILYMHRYVLEQLPELKLLFASKHQTPCDVTAKKKEAPGIGRVRGDGRAQKLQIALDNGRESNVNTFKSPKRSPSIDLDQWTVGMSIMFGR